MTLYSIYAKPDKGPDALTLVGERFTWTAFLFTPLWALAKRAWGFLALWLVLVLALVFAAPVIGPDAAVGLYVLLALWSGFAAAQIAGRALSRRDWMVGGEVWAPDSETALALWLERTYGTRR